jgi:hypothetical protein
MSGVLKTVGSILTSPINAAVGLFKGPGRPPTPIAPPTRDDAAAATARDDEIRRRRGSAADMLLGPSAGEAQGVSAKTLTGE